MLRYILILFNVLLFTITHALSQGTWTQKANFGPGPRGWASSFSIGAKGYIGLGVNPLSVRWNDFWEWDQATNVWTQKANFPGVARDNAVGFSIGTKGYLGTGGIYSGGPFYDDLWEWDQATDAWTQKANFGGAARNGATGFAIGTKGYIGTGRISGTFTDDFWEWDQASNTWTQKASFPGGVRYCASSFAIGTKGYIGTGYNGVYQQSFWEWDQTSNVWTQQANFGGGLMSSGTGFSIGNCGYMGIGGSSATGNLTSDFWEFCPGTVSTPTISSSASTTLCQGQSTVLSVSINGNYTWNIGATTTSITVSPAVTTTYSVTSSLGCSCSGSDQITITVITCSTPVSSFSSSTNSVCKGNCIQFSDLSTGSPNAWSWSFTGGTPSSSIAQNPLICYDIIGIFNVSLTVSNANGTDTTILTNYVTVNDCYCPELSLPNAFSPNGDNENDLFLPQGTKCVKTFSMIIYNYWGEKVFETTEVSMGWDGKYNGEIENTAVFTYYLDATLNNGKKINKKGNISLVR